MLTNTNGITIKELKELIKNLPETDEFGENYEVWIETQNGFSSPVTLIQKLNAGDILISRHDSVRTIGHPYI